MNVSDRLEMKNCRKQAWQLYCKGGRTLLGATILYYLISSCIVSPVLTLVTNAALSVSGEGYFVNHFFGLFSKPLYLLALAASFAFSLLWAFYSICLLVHGFDMIRKEEPLTLKALYGHAFKSVLRALRPRNWMVLILSGIILPFLMPMAVTDFITRIEIPEFILEVILTTPLFLVLFSLIILALIVLSIRWMFLFHSFVLEGASFAEARKKSAAITGRKWFRCLWWQFIGKFLATWKIYLLAIGVVAALLGISVLVKRDGFALACSVACGHFLIPLFAAIIDAHANIASYAVMDCQYEQFAGGRGPVSKSRVKANRALSASVITCYVLGALIGIGIIAGVTLFPRAYLSRLDAGGTTITAHRGYTMNAAENTLPAFTDAIESGIIEYGELDVQQTKDGYVVLNHDATLGRVTGENVAVYELTMDEIKALAVTTAARSTGEPVSAPIPTLDEVIKACKGKIKLNIEIKNFPETPNLIADTVRIIEENDFVSECVITSLEYADLEAVKALNPDIRCGYTVNIAGGNYYDLPACDFFSVETSFVNRDMVEELHSRGKEVHCWTVMTAEVAQQMQDCGVDSIITNEPILVATALFENAATPLRLFSLYIQLTSSPDEAEALSEI